MKKGMPLDYSQVNDVLRLVYRVPGFVFAIQKLQSMAMCRPFKVKINGMPTELHHQMEQLSKTVWMSTAKQLLIYKLAIGIIPYYEKPIKKTAHRYPKIPSFFQGHIETLEGDDGYQMFQWRWYKNKPERPPIKWIYTGYEPDLDGQLRSPVMACLEKFRILELARKDVLAANYHLANPLAIYEDRPPATVRDDKAGESNMIDHFSEDVLIERFQDSMIQQSEQKIRYARAKELEHILLRNGILSNTVKAATYTGPVLNSDEYDRDFQRERFLHNHVILPPDRHYVGQAKPSILLDIEQLDESLTKDASELVGIPIELTRSSNKNYAANRQGTMTITSETTKAHIQWINETLTEMYIDIYGETILNGWDRKSADGELRLYPAKRFRTFDSEVRYDLELANVIEIEVELQCNPAVSEQHIITFYEKGFMSKEDAADQLTSITGLPPGMLKALKIPKELQKEQPKAPKQPKEPKQPNEDKKRELEPEKKEETKTEKDDRKRQKIQIAAHVREIWKRGDFKK